MASIVVQTEYTLIQCGGCGIGFAVPEPWRLQKHTSRTTFHCPNGCIRMFISETGEEKAQRETREVQAQLNIEAHRRLVTERELERVKAEAQRIKNRIARGVCSCCNRSFKDLASHMKTKHPRELPEGKTRKQIEAPING